MKSILLIIFSLLPLLATSQTGNRNDDESMKTLIELSRKSVSYYRQGQADSANACFETIARIYPNISNRTEAARVVYLPLCIYLYSKSITAKADVLGMSDYTWYDVQRSLGDDDIAIEFFDIPTANGRFYSAVSLCKGDTLPVVTTLFYENQIHEIANVWEKLSPRLKGMKNIYFAPIDVLHWTPIEYSPDVDTFRVYRLTSTRELVSRPHRKHDFRSAVLFGGINSGGELLYTKEEVDTIGAILTRHHVPCTVYSGEHATEANFKALSGKAPDIIHIATHGFWWNREKAGKVFPSTSLSEEDSILNQSGLLLSGADGALQGSIPKDTDDGILTSSEISQMNFHGTGLVVLSGCDTGTGAPKWGEGIWGLQRAFKKAGAGAILMSANRVDDRATQILMDSFYRHLLDGSTMREALLAAQTDVCNYEDGIYSAPKYWMNFILIDAFD